MNQILPSYMMTEKDILSFLSSRKEGLTYEEASALLISNGKNALREENKESIAKKVLKQFKDLMIIILLVAAVISGIFGDLGDTFIILAVVVLNAVIGTIQEYKAEKALDALKKMSLPFSKVRRGGVVSNIKSEDIVKGDIVILDAGDFVPADLRILESSSLRIEEAAITGESVPSEKNSAAITESGIVLNDMKNMAFSGTYVVYGRGEGIVTETGMHTEVGKIASLIMSHKEEQTPLQKNIHRTGKVITYAILVIAAIVFAVGIINGKSIIDMFMMSISLAVAAIPEGLPAIITIVLAIGVQRMAKQNAIIRKLSSVETLGCTEIICTDKTGTLTQNRMTVREIYSNNLNIHADQFKPVDKTLQQFAKFAVLCNDSRLSGSGENIEIIGDPTENALVRFGFDCGFDKNLLEKESPRLFDLPFDSDRKMMTVVHKIGNEYFSVTKGAPDILLSQCREIETEGTIKSITDNDRNEINAVNKRMADKALRVLAVAYKPVSEHYESLELEKDLVFSGLVGMIDPPRQEVKPAIANCKKSGITTIMITGDHADTAFAIASELGIAKNREEIITGAALNNISDKEFESSVHKYRVYARVSPEHKLRIVKAWKKKGKIVAMTGDGVNDAPALKASDIGIGMGITGTDVTKSVANMVLADDNFATIIIAVEEGRLIYGNITKAIQFLLACNLGEVLTVFIATMIGWTVLLPVHILWINLITDTLPALALGVDKTNISVMSRKPRKSTDSIFSNGVGLSILYQGILEGLITLGVFYYALKTYGGVTATTMAFATLGMIQLAHSFNVRSNTASVFSTGIFKNRFLIGAIMIAAFFQIVPIIFSPFNAAFKTVPLASDQWSIIITAALLMIAAVEVIKLTAAIVRKTKGLILK